MKKALFAVVLFVTLLLFTTGCCHHAADSDLTPASSSTTPAPTHSSSAPFLVLERWAEEEKGYDGYVFTHYNYIVVDIATGVMYHQSFSISSGYGVGLGSTFSVLLNADGTPRIYDGPIPAK